MQINDLFKQTILPMSLAKVKLIEGQDLQLVEQNLNDWIVETKSVLLSVPFVSKTEQNYLLAVTYMESSNGS